MNIIKIILTDFENDKELQKKLGFTCDYDPDDPIGNILNYYRIWQTAEDKHIYLPRLLYDGDARYYNELLGVTANERGEPLALYGDTIISFYTPYKVALKRAAKKAGISNLRQYDKSKNPFAYLYENKSKEPYNEVNKKFEAFAGVCHSVGNFMLIPNRSMQSRYRYTHDRIDYTLELCFKGGALCKYFNDDNCLRDWIVRENLGFLFRGSDEKGSVADEIITKDNIISLKNALLRKEGTDEFGVPESPYILYSRMTDEELDRFIANAVELIRRRSNVINAEHVFPA